MKELKTEYFKISLIIILIGFLYVSYQYSQNGRFVHIGGLVTMDTHTGTIFKSDVIRASP